MEIRLGSVSDIPPIMRIVEKVVAQMNAGGNFQWTHEYPNVAGLEKDVENRSLHVAILEGRLVSFIVLDENQAPEYAPIAWRRDAPALVMHRFAVDPAAGGKGVANRMEQFVCQHAKSKGLCYIRTDTNSANTVMQKFLGNRDFLFTGRLYFTKCDNPFFCYDKIPD